MNGKHISLILFIILFITSSILNFYPMLFGSDPSMLEGFISAVTLLSFIFLSYNMGKFQSGNYMKIICLLFITGIISVLIYWILEKYIDLMIIVIPPILLFMNPINGITGHIHGGVLAIFISIALLFLITILSYKLGCRHKKIDIGRS